MSKRVSNPTTTTDSVALANLLQDTLAFEDKVSGWEDDGSYRSEGGSIVYAVDTDIFSFYVDPYEMGPDRINPATGKRQRAGYSQIFRDDPKEVPGVIAEAISQSIFFDTGRPPEFETHPRPMVLFSGVDEEVFLFINSLLTELASASENFRDGALEKEILELSRVLKTVDLEEKYRLVQENTPILFRFFFSKNSIKKKAQRVLQIAEEARVLHIGSIGDSDIEQFPYDFISACKRIHHSNNVSQRERILGELREIFPIVSSKAEMSYERDLSVLSELLVLNENLHSKKIKVCFISGAWSLFNALSKVKVDRETGRTIFPGSDEYEMHTLSADKALLRYPMAFWGSRSFKENMRSPAYSGASHEFLDNWPKWADTIIPNRLAHGPLPSRNETLSYARRAINMGLDKSHVEEFRTSWSAFSSLLIPSRAEALHEIDAEFSEVFSDLPLAFKNTVNLLFDSCASLGIVVSSLASNGIPSRLNPPIIFDCNQKAQDAVDAVERAILPNKKKRGTTDFRQAMNSLRTSPNGQYFFNVGVAIIYAAQRQYESALLFVNRAIQEALRLEASEVEKSRITGREAYFLRSSLLRLRARKLSDFDEAKSMLRLARHRLTVGARRDPELGISSVRFDCEDVACDLAKQLFKKFRLQKHRGLSIDEVRKFLSRIKRVSESKYESLDEQFRERLEVQLSINALSVGLHSTNLVKSLGQHPKIQDELVAHLEKVTLGGNSPKAEDLDATYLHKAVKAAAKCLLYGDQNDNSIREHLVDVFSDKNIHSHQVTAYDPERYRELREICFSRAGIS